MKKSYIMDDAFKSLISWMMLSIDVKNAQKNILNGKSNTAKA
ncbi:MAG: hypothetical protein ACI4DZ_07510 [Oliverpabstia sp.]